MKFSFAATLFFAGSALAETIGFMVKLLDSYDGKLVSLPVNTNRDRLYVPGNYDYNMYLQPQVDESKGTSTLSTFEDPARFVNVDSDGFLVLSNKPYVFNDKFDSPNLQNIVINNIDTFYLVANDIDSYDIKVLDVAPKGGIPINLGQIGVATWGKRNKAVTYTTYVV